MSDTQWEQDIDETQDYYKALGVTPMVTPDELKTAYVQLALQHHPDTAMNKEDSKHHSAEFIKISEAWSILSRPEIRTRYDSLRGRYLGLGDKFGSLTMSDLANSMHSDIPVGYNTQKVNFGRVQHHAGATMEDTLSRSRMEKWHSTPLSEKKIRRTRGLTSVPSIAATWIIPLIVAGGVAYGIYTQTRPKNSNSR